MCQPAFVWLTQGKRKTYDMETNRLIQLLRWNIISRKGQLFRSFIGGILGVFFGMTCANGFWFSDGPAGTSTVGSMAVILIIVFGVMILKNAAGIGFNTTTKTGFISYAMLPATNAEKYTANWLYVTVILTVLHIASFIAGDFVQMAVSMIVHGDANSLMLHVTRMLLPSWNGFALGDIAGLPAGVLWLLVTHASFILGGTLFRKHQFIYTCLLMWVAVPFVITTVFGSLGALLVRWLDANDLTMQVEWHVGEGFISLSVILFEAAVICFLYWLSFRLFCRSQIINNRVFNS